MEWIKIIMEMSFIVDHLNFSGLKLLLKVEVMHEVLIIVQISDVSKVYTITSPLISLMN